MNRAIISSLTALTALGVNAQEFVQCGSDFSTFMTEFGQYAIKYNISESAVNAVIDQAKQREDVLKLDRSQATFKQNFLEFSSRTVSADRLERGRENLEEYQDIFERMETEFKVDKEVITAFWAMETDFGVNQGDVHTISALATLANDCRRPELFQPQLLGAMELVARGDMDPQKTKGAWAGEIGMVQMLPADILRLGIDGDKDGQIDLIHSPADALLSAAHMLQSHGWKFGEPWIEEVKVTRDEAWKSSGLDQKLTVAKWSELGVMAKDGNLDDADIEASLVAPQGRFGPIFLTYPNYDIFLEWNKSFIYSLSAAYMATRYEGAPAFESGEPETGLELEEVKELQERLNALGHEIGEIDGIIGANTRKSVRLEQIRLGMIADGWPTPALLEKLRAKASNSLPSSAE